MGQKRRTSCGVGGERVDLGLVLQQLKHVEFFENAYGRIPGIFPARDYKLQFALGKWA